jgi:predicted nucleic acid-binding protein
MVLVDTRLLVDYVRGKRTAETEWLDDALGVPRIAICDLILCELLQGTISDAPFSQVQEKMASCDLVLTSGRELAIVAARNYRFLRQHGYTVRKLIDCFGRYRLHREPDSPFAQRP